MDVVVLGLNHDTAPIELRERLAFAADTLPAALSRLVKLPGVPEGMILSTCNRVELYVATSGSDAALVSMREWLSSSHGIPPAELEGRLYARSGVDAIRHIFRVVSSLDSLIVGEPQIVAQVKEAYQVALGLRAAGATLNRVLHKALSVSKRVRTETAIAAHAVSVSYAAVELARKIFGDLKGKTVLLVGAGEMGELAAKHLQKNGAREILVANRTYERAVDLAKDFGGTPVQFEKLGSWLGNADIVVCAAAGQGHEYLIGKSMVQDAIRVRRHRPIFLIDIAVPRTVDPASNQLGDVYLYSIDDLKGVVDANIAERRREAAKAEAIIASEADEFLVALAKVELGPTIGLLSGKLEALRKAELARAGTLSPAERDAVDRVTKALIGKIAHDPITALKDGLLDAETLRRAFALSVEPVPLPLDEAEGRGAAASAAESNFAEGRGAAEGNFAASADGGTFEKKKPSGTGDA